MLGQDKEGVKLDMRQTILGSCALDGEGYCIKGGRNMGVSRQRRVMQTQLGRYKTEREIGS